MKIFFTAAITGGRANTPNFQMIVKHLSTLGEVLGGHVSKDNMSGFGETELSSNEILEREMDNLKQSDLVVAEVTTPSLGVGYLINEAGKQNKKVIALLNSSNKSSLSAMVKGDKNVEVHLYENEDDIKKITFSSQYH